MLNPSATFWLLFVTKCYKMLHLDTLNKYVFFENYIFIFKAFMVTLYTIFYVFNFFFGYFLATFWLLFVTKMIHLDTKISSNP
ncbi:MAG: hypothetical protein CMQ53_04915 [Gammaproteobacteria bacterium]|nr:hypothetical protein [Gammaproteobacteria bacterium]